MINPVQVTGNHVTGHEDIQQAKKLTSVSKPWEEERFGHEKVDEKAAQARSVPEYFLRCKLKITLRKPLAEFYGNK